MKQLILSALACTLLLPWSFGQNESAAMKQYRKTRYREIALIIDAAEAGSAVAQYTLGEVYTEGNGVPQNASKALNWYRKAAEQGAPDAQKKIGYLYEFGSPVSGVQEDKAEAAIWFRKALEGYLDRARLGDANAQYELGAAYYYGNGVPKDYVKAYVWCNLAAALGEAALGDGGWGKVRHKEVLRLKRNSREELTDEQTKEAQVLSTELFHRIYQQFR